MPLLLNATGLCPGRADLTAVLQGGRNIMPDFRVDAAARSKAPNAAEAFVGGLFHHLQPLLLYTLPSPGSSMRSKVSTWAGAYR